MSTTTCVSTVSLTGSLGSPCAVAAQSPRCRRGGAGAAVSGALSLLIDLAVTTSSLKPWVASNFPFGVLNANCKSRAGWLAVDLIGG